MFYGVCHARMLRLLPHQRSFIPPTSGAYTVLVPTPPSSRSPPVRVCKTVLPFTVSRILLAVVVALFVSTTVYWASALRFVREAIEIAEGGRREHDRAALYHLFWVCAHRAPPRQRTSAGLELGYT